MRGVRGVGLVLVDERRRGVGVLVHVISVAEDAVGAGLVGRPRQHHEIGGAAGNVERIIGLQGIFTVPLPPLVTKSRPWSKNWPNRVNQELKAPTGPHRV